MRTEPLQIRNFIDGQFVEPVAGKYLDNIEPATGKPYSRVAESGSRDVDLAVTAAARAFADWSHTAATERSRILLRIADLIERDLEKLARAESIDTGKPLSLARSLDIPRAASNFRFFATAILHTESEAHVTDNVAFNYTLRQPRGIAGLISPWNLPLYLLSWKIAPAIAVGNTAIAKPSIFYADSVAKLDCPMAYSTSSTALGQMPAPRSPRIQISAPFHSQVVP